MRRILTLSLTQALTSAWIAFSSIVMMTASAAQAQDVYVTVNNVPYRIYTQTGSFNDDAVYGSGQQNEPAPSNTPWWSGTTDGSLAQTFAQAYAAATDLVFPTVYFAYSVTGTGNAFRSYAVAGDTVSRVNPNLGRSQGGLVFARGVQVPEIDGAVLGRVVMSLGVLHLCLLGLKRRRAAV